MRCVRVGRQALGARASLSSPSFFSSSANLSNLLQSERASSSHFLSFAALAGFGLSQVGVCKAEEDSEFASEKFIQDEAERHYKEALEAAYRLKVLHIQNVEHFLALEVEKSFLNSLAQKKAEKGIEVNSEFAAIVEKAIATEAEESFSTAEKAKSVVKHSSKAAAAAAPATSSPPPPIPVAISPSHEEPALPSSLRVDEFEVFQKWKTFIEGETQKQLKAVEESYEKKLKEIHDLFEEKVSSEIARQKEILNGRFQQKFRSEVEKIRSKFSSDFEHRSGEVEKDAEHRSLVLENEYYAKLEAEKEKHQAQLLQVENEMKMEVELLRSVVIHEHTSRLEKLKALLQSQRDQELYQAKLSSHLSSLNHSLSLSLSALSLLKLVNDGTPFVNAIEEVKKSTSDADVLSLLNSIPSDVAKTGIPSLFVLQARFAEVVEIAFSDSLMGNNVSFGTFVRSKVASKFINRKKGMVTGNTVEEQLARAEYYLSTGDLTKCITELEAVKGPAEVSLASWLNAAKERQRILSTVDAIESLVQLSLRSKVAQ